jgi:hypothetical protein
MKLYIPVFGFAEKIIQTNFIQRFLEIFRDTKDIHRVIVVVPLTLLISHSLYLRGLPHMSDIFFKPARAEVIWFGLFCFPVAFGYLWAVFSSPLNPALYIRQTIFIIWTALLHRWSYGLETFGTPYATVISLLALTSYLPFALWGLRPDQLFMKLIDDYKARKNADTEYQEVPIPPKVQSDAA